MGNDIFLRNDAFGMNIELIGTNLIHFKEIISKAKSSNSIQKYWKFHYDNKISVNEQINTYFDKLQKIKKGNDKTINLRECVLIKIKNIFDPEINLIVDKVNSLGQTQYMPIVLFLLENNYSNDIRLSIDNKKYKRIDLRLIMLTKYDENDTENIEALLLRFCSIHNELGDRFTVGKGDKAEDYDLIEYYFPFNVNIACIGRFGQGKSTGVNAILSEYKAKESAKGSAQTKELTFYQVSDQPIRLLDIPGFEDTDTVKKAVEKFQKCGEKINKIKDNLHIVLYFLNYGETRSFAGMEFPILEELCKHRTSKIIYVITHSNPNMDDQDKEEKIESINEGLQNLTKDTPIFKESKKGGMLNANMDNVAFVNFHRDNKNGFEPFGLKELFKKIYDFFILSEDYINSCKVMNDDYVNKQAERLRAQAKDILLSNKVWGGVVGIIPGVDWLLQKFVIKKNAAKKLGTIYGIDVRFLGEKENNKNIKKYRPEYITASMDTEHLKMEVKGEELIKETTAFTVGNSFKVTGEAATYIGGGAAVGTGILRTATTAAESATSTATATTAVVGVGSTALKVVGTGLFVIGAAVGIALGGYFTHKYCEELIDKFEEYYKTNAQKIGNSYKQAAEYLLNQYNY